MKLPVIKHIYRNTSVAEIDIAIKVLEVLSESPTLKGEEQDVLGEFISNLCGALEVHQLVADGMEEKDACNAFMKKVMGSIDR